MVEVISKQVQCRVRDDFRDLTIVDSSVTSCGKFVVENESAIPDQLQGEFQNGVRLAVDGPTQSSVTNLFRRQPDRLADCRMSTHAIVTGTFLANGQSDLYYRLSVFPIELPPLTERKEDIPLLAEHLLAQLSRKLGRPAPRLTRANVQELQRYNWPGNIRDLQHVLERSLITSKSGKLRLNLHQRTPDIEPPVSVVDTTVQASKDEVLTVSDLRFFEANNIRRALERTGGKIYGPGGAAELLDMKPTTLASRIKSLGIDPKP